MKIPDLRAGIESYLYESSRIDYIESIHNTGVFGGGDDDLSVAISFSILCLFRLSEKSITPIFYNSFSNKNVLLRFL